MKLNIWSYKDDVLAEGKHTPRQMEIIKKEICQIFKNNNLAITITANIKNTDFLDINLDLPTRIFKPFIKPNDTPLYVHKLSNHPPHILKNIPLSIENRLSRISANQKVFEKTRAPYQEALEKSG